MEYSRIAKPASRTAADMLIVPCWHTKKKAESACEKGDWDAAISGALAMGDFKGKSGESLLVYTEGKEKRVLLIGLGDVSKLSSDSLRAAFSKAALQARSYKCKRVHLVLPQADEKVLERQAVVRAIAEGLEIANYSFDALKHDALKDNPTCLIEKMGLIDATAKDLATAQRCGVVGSGINFARDLQNGNAQDITPQALAQAAKELAKKYPSIKTTVFDKARIAKEGMGLLLAVGQGSVNEPVFIQMAYTGDPSSKEHTVIIGKGVTYDTGGLNLKPTGFMETMKTDMSGAAAVFGTLKALAELKLKVNVTGVVAATENAIDGGSYRPGDVFRSYNGTTVEIDNTDAEGRLTLADALSYSVKNLKPTQMINLATLTGAVVIALGEEIAGLMTDHEGLAERLIACGKKSGDAVWRLPLPPSYRKMLDSDIADIKNAGGRPGSVLTAGLFLKEFVDDKVPWAHLDIAGTAYPKKARPGYPGCATGYGVSLLVEFLSR